VKVAVIFARVVTIITVAQSLDSADADRRFGVLPPIASARSLVTSHAHDSSRVAPATRSRQTPLAAVIPTPNAAASYCTPPSE
jgi:hypothetical protein